MFSCEAAAVVDDVRSGWLTVGVVGDGALLSDFVDADGFSEDVWSESPRAGRSTGRSAGRSVLEMELYDELVVSGESFPTTGGEEVKFGSINGLLRRADMSISGEVWDWMLESESWRFASAFLFFGTSCNLKGSVFEAAGEAC